MLHWLGKFQWPSLGPSTESHDTRHDDDEARRLRPACRARREFSRYPSFPRRRRRAIRSRRRFLLSYRHRYRQHHDEPRNDDAATR